MTSPSVSDCPNCIDPNVMVYDTRMEQHGWRRRRRHCKSCGYKWSTLEIPADELHDLIHLRDQLIVLHQRMTFMLEPSKPRPNGASAGGKSTEHEQTGAIWNPDGVY